MADRNPFDLAPLKVEGGATPFDPGSASEPVNADHDMVTLPSGFRFYAHNLVVGISPDGQISEGYDGGIDAEELTAQDRRELAERMISLWRTFGGIDG